MSKKRYLEADLAHHKRQQKLEAPFKHVRLGLLVLTSTAILTFSTCSKSEGTNFFEKLGINQKSNNIQCTYNPNEVVCGDTTYSSKTITSQDDVLNFGAYVAERFPTANIQETYGHPDNNKYMATGPKQEEKYTVVLEQ